jgi:hypothetical protein
MEAIMFLLLFQMGDQAIKTRIMILGTTKYINQRIQERYKVTPTILAISCLQTQNMKNKTKATCHIHIDLKISTAENQ